MTKIISDQRKSWSLLSSNRIVKPVVNFFSPDIHDRQTGGIETWSDLWFVRLNCRKWSSFWPALVKILVACRHSYWDISQSTQSTYDVSITNVLLIEFFWLPFSTQRLSWYVQSNVYDMFQHLRLNSNLITLMKYINVHVKNDASGSHICTTCYITNVLVI